MIIGLDIGTTTTKLVGVIDGRLVSAVRIETTDNMSLLYDALCRVLSDNNLTLNDVEKVMLTGVGSSNIEGLFYGLPTFRVDEFKADAMGAAYCYGFEKMVVVSMGTGSTFVKYDKGDIEHLGGIGMGGGTLVGLARVLLDTDDVQQVVDMASKGNIANVNLLISDVAKEPIPGLPECATSSLFAKATKESKPEDVALALIWMVIETIGSAAVLAAKPTGINDLCMVGNLSALPQCAQIFDLFHRVYGINMHVSEHSPFATAIGTTINL